MKKRIIIGVVCMIFFVSLAGNIFFFLASFTHSDISYSQFIQNEKKYPLISKRVLQEYPVDILINFLPLREEIKKTTQSYGDTFALYFEYLPTGTSIGIHEKQDFVAASLFKLPVIMAYYHQKERTGTIDDPEVVIKKEYIDNRFGDLWKQGEGTKINLKDAVTLGIVKSDNTAVNLLVPHIAQSDFDDVYEGLDIDLRLQDKGAILTAKHYSSILKALYFSAVLTKDSSEEILDLMTKTDFSDKLPAGVPAGVPVAHKIGVIEGEGYMDCGIVYAPRRPYLLCMVSQSSEEVARIRMRNLSKIIYTYVTKK